MKITENLASTSRFLKMKDAAKYIGVTYNTFRCCLRPLLTEIKFSKQPYFDRLEIDLFLEDYKRVNGRAPRNLEVLKWQKIERQRDLLKEAKFGILTKPSVVYELEKVLKRAT